ncbi:MAG: SIS domain-containing protein [Armatimonadota bacterium]|nr:SIS domain-containing protein [Armatimonadota bacterium]MDR7550588.1 SIS domain-containing protein [Armatimonadota bacterium]
MTAPSHAMLSEIREQPQVLARMLAEHAAGVGDAVAALRRRKPTLVVFVARGTSHNAAVYGQYLIETLLRIPTATAMPSVTTLYGRTPDWTAAAVIGISQSGRSVDVSEVVAEARKQGALTVAITNDVASPLAQTSAHVLPLSAGPELSVTATKTFTASLAMLAALVVGWGQHRDLARGLSRLPDAVTAALRHEETVAALAKRYARRDPWIVTTRGYMLGVADETALKLKETAYAAAESLSAAELLHGPIAALDRKSTVILLLPPGRTRASLIDLRVQLRVRPVPTLTFAFGDDPGDVAVNAGLPEALAPVAAAPVVHLFAYYVSVARGLNPDRPRGLRKVTLTR